MGGNRPPSPWFSSYLAQQWMPIKVTWYKLQAEEGSEPPVDRLAAYLQAQYYERVLAPAAHLATALVGGVAGTVISIGAAGLGLMLHAQERGPIERELRAILDEEMVEMWRQLVEDPQTGVSAGIHLLAGQIERNLQRTQVQPVVSIVPPAERPLAAPMNLQFSSAFDCGPTSISAPLLSSVDD